MEKVKYVCQECGYEAPKWLGRCPGCGGWNTFVEEPVEPRRKLPTGLSSAPVPINSVSLLPEARVSTGIGEFDRVLGGGIVPASLILLGGDPGIGKSTLLLQVASKVAGMGHTVLYVSGEESVRQTKIRADRLGIKVQNLFLLSETNLDEIRRHIEGLSPSLVVVDSIQTVYDPALPSAPGSVGQVRECAASFLHLAKAKGIAIALVGHVTKEGQIAGPRVLEHIVDTVLYFEGDRHQTYRILRTTKNRFGSTNEIGVFEMSTEGLREVQNPSAAFLSERPTEVPGSAVICALEGTRPLLVEVQALAISTPFGMPRRTASGVDYNRVILLLAVLEKRAGLQLATHDVYVNVAGGVRVSEPAADLGVAVAVASSLRDRPVDARAVVIGEVGLGGEVRAVPQIQRRLTEVVKLGFQRCLIPRGNPYEPVAGLEVIPVASVLEALNLVLQ
ncbi:MAG: DNA repair protein RadA [Armatimonadota bacterium]|nr:DNA repair protein RadA [Armatimonadota bacterium]MDR5703898.1 DNA repair protein RadA [Armatimonadota bacterium]MDR7435737.1 DNA repair protein RadA [Armatimonadota bacterium]